MDSVLKFIPFLSVPIAAIAAIIAYKSREVSKKALRIALDTYNDRQSKFGMYLIDGLYHQESTQDRRIILLNVSINNISDTKNSFTAFLEFEYSSDSRDKRQVIINHDPELASKVGSDAVIPFELNPRLEEKHTTSKWLCFLEPEKVLIGYRNTKYKLILKDNKNVEIHLDVYLLRALK